MNTVMSNFISISILLPFFLLAVRTENVPLVEVSNGWLEGTLQKSYNGRVYSSFQGIPYAQPPVGELRFEAPKQIYNWTGTWKANTRYSCMYYTDSVLGDENCLYLNVYVPREQPTSSDNLNVIVHIHGGSFMLWDANFYAGAKYLMDEEVIFVTMNYRLGALGFLSTEDNIIPGNNGMKDQVLSLQWIQENIKYFGGNPNSVTLTGASAGGASVHLHYFSHLSEGLFHRGVSQSGTALDPWVIQREQLKHAKKLGEKIGCSMETSLELANCLKSRSAKEIVQSQNTFMSIEGDDRISFGPVIEKENDGAFITEHPYTLLINKEVTDVPWIVSANEWEGIFFVQFLPKPISEMFNSFDQIAPNMLYYHDSSEWQKLYITKSIKEYYFREHQDINTLSQVISDRLFLSGADKSAKLQAQANESPTYFYIFGYKGQHNFLEFLSPKIENNGPTHCDDVMYYLHTPIAEETLSEEDEGMKSVFLRWLTTYADNKEPQIEGGLWNSVSGGELLEFLYFEDPSEIHMEVAEGLGVNAFWNHLPLEEHQDRLIFKDEL